MAIMFTRLLTISAKFVDSSIYNDSSRFDVSAMWRSPSGIFSRKMIRALVLLCMAVLPLVRCHKVRSPVDEYHRDRDRQGRCYSRANASLKQRTRVCVCVSWSCTVALTRNDKIFAESDDVNCRFAADCEVNSRCVNTDFRW